MGFKHWLEAYTVYPAPRVHTSILASQAEKSEAEEVHINAEDGTQLYGWWIRGGHSRAVLYFSGNRSTVGSNPERYARLLGAGFDVLHINYRGYPGSQGRPSENGLRMDARAAWFEITRHHPPEKVLVLGSSLGGGIAMGVAAEFEPGALVLMSTFHSARRVAYENNPAWLVRCFMVSKLDSASLAPAVTCPTLLLHGEDDDMIHPKHAEDLSGCFSSPTKVLIVPGASHRTDLLAHPPAWKSLVDISAHLLPE